MDQHYLPLRTLACCAIFFALLPAFAQNTWEPLGIGHSVGSITSKVDTLYVSSYGNGILRTTDDGATWVPVMNGLPNDLIRSVGRAGNDLLTGHNSGIYRSTDGGDSWQISNTGIPPSATYARKFFHFGGTTLAIFNGDIASGGGIYRSQNNGASWSMGHSGMGTNMIVYHLAYTNDLIFAATSVGLFASTDQALSWAPVAGANYTTFSVQMMDARVLTLTTFGLRYSDDWGASWNSAGNGLPAVPARGEMIVYDGKIFVITGEGTGTSQVYRSLDGGLNFSVFANGLSVSDATNQNTFHASGDRLYLGALLDGYSLPGSTVGTLEVTGTKISLHPTLFSEGFMVQGLADNGTVLLIDASGREVLRHKVDQGTNFIPRGSLASGSYSCIVFDADRKMHHLGTIVAQ